MAAERLEAMIPHEQRDVATWAVAAYLIESLLRDQGEIPNEEVIEEEAAKLYETVERLVRDGWRPQYGDLDVFATGEEQEQREQLKTWAKKLGGLGTVRLRYLGKLLDAFING